MRAEGTAIYSLVRNIGSSIGIAMVQTLLVRNTQIAHASLGAHVNYANPALQDAGVATIYNLANGAGLSALNAEITRQASMIAYVDDYWLMMILTLGVIPLLLLVRSARRGAAPPAVDHAALE
jgi:DHA2 family multidrug resistance protein